MTGSPRQLAQLVFSPLISHVAALLVPGAEHDALRGGAIDQKLVHSWPVRVAMDHAPHPCGAKRRGHRREIDVHDLRHGARGVTAAAGTGFIGDQLDLYERVRRAIALAKQVRLEDGKLAIDHDDVAERLASLKADTMAIPAMTLASIAESVVRAITPLPTTAKIRIGWEADSVNAVHVAKILTDCGISALTVHGRTRAQGYSGAADWNVIGEVAAAVSIPVIGNGDLTSAANVAKRRRETGICGAMIGRAAMSTPWIFRETKAYLANGAILDPPALEERWQLILRHCELTVRDWGTEEPAIRSMRARLMAYSKSMPEAKRLREKFSQVSTITDVQAIAEENISQSALSLAVA